MPKKMNCLQQAILQTPSETNSPGEVLALAYQMLTDKQKIAFILAGGAPSLFHYQQSTQTGLNTDKLPNSKILFSVLMCKKLSLFLLRYRNTGWVQLRLGTISVNGFSNYKT
jgi:hypothetical protein